MIYGYADNTKDVINDVNKMYSDDVTHSNLLRPNLELLLSVLKPNDTVVVKSLGQLNWGVRNLLLLLIKLLNNDVNVKIFDLNVDLSMYKGLIEDIFSANTRQFEQLKNVSPKPKRKINKINKPLWDAYYLLLKEKSIGKKEMAQKLGLTLPTFYRHFKQYESSLTE